MGRGTQGCFTQGRFWEMLRGKGADEGARLLRQLQSLAPLQCRRLLFKSLFPP